MQISQWSRIAFTAALTMAVSQVWAGTVAQTPNGLAAAPVTNITGAQNNNGSNVSMTKESLTINVVSGDSDVAGATCKLSNPKGEWSMTAPGTVDVRRVNGDLQVECDKPGFEPGMQTIKASSIQIPKPHFRFSTDSGGSGDDDDAMVTVPNYQDSITVSLNAKASN